MKQIVIDKTVYGGMLVEKYFLILDDGIDIQVPYREWELYNKGDEYPKRLPESFNQAVKDIEEGKTVPLDTALNEEPPTESETFKKICKEIEELYRQIEEYKIGHDRYEKLRRLSPKEFHDLYDKNLNSGTPFDTLVDQL
jgi:hypothetical protein